MFLCLQIESNLANFEPLATELMVETLLHFRIWLFKCTRCTRCIIKYHDTSGSYHVLCDSSVITPKIFPPMLLLGGDICFLTFRSMMGALGAEPDHCISWRSSFIVDRALFSSHPRFHPGMLMGSLLLLLTWKVSVIPVHSVPKMLMSLYCLTFCWNGHVCLGLTSSMSTP